MDKQVALSTFTQTPSALQSHVRVMEGASQPGPAYALFNAHLLPQGALATLVIYDRSKLPDSDVPGHLNAFGRFVSEVGKSTLTAVDIVEKIAPPTTATAEPPKEYHVGKLIDTAGSKRIVLVENTGTDPTKQSPMAIAEIFDVNAEQLNATFIVFDERLMPEAVVKNVFAWLANAVGIAAKPKSQVELIPARYLGRANAQAAPQPGTNG